jgi:hypothetical protein
MPLRKATFNVAAAGNANILPAAGSFFSIDIKEITGVAAPGTITFYDNTAASGAIVGVIRIGIDGEHHFEWAKGVRLFNGLHIAAAGADVVGSVTVGGGAGMLRALPFAGADIQLSNVPRVVDSMLVAETAGAAAEWRAYDALTATGVPFVGASPVANETIKIGWPMGGIQLDTGLFYDQQGGAAHGAVYVY